MQVTIKNVFNLIVIHKIQPYVRCFGRILFLHFKMCTGVVASIIYNCMFPTSGETSMEANSGMNDFELMMAKKKAERGGRRRRRDIHVINDNDDLIAHLLQQMRRAADEDRELNAKGQPAVRKVCY